MTRKVGGDEDEQPLNEMMQAIASSRNRNMDGVLARVVKALGKLRNDPDSFGECEECGDPTAVWAAQGHALCGVLRGVPGQAGQAQGRPHAQEAH